MTNRALISFTTALAVLWASAATAALPDSMWRGFNIFAFRAEAFSNKTTLAELDELAKLDVDIVQLMFILEQDNATANRVYPSSVTASDASLRTILRHAKAVGLKAILKPLVLFGDSGTFIDVNPADPDLWFNSYGSQLVHYAQMAAEEDAFGMSVGLELIRLTMRSVHVPRWLKLINAVRTVFPKSVLSYNAIAGYESSNTSREFWNALDYVGLDFYLPFANSSVPLPPMPEIAAKWAFYMQRLREWRAQMGLNDKPVVFTEVGYPSHRTCLIQPAVDPPACAGDFAPDEQCQSVGYEALFAMASKAEHADLLQGIFLFWLDNPSSKDFIGPPHGPKYDCMWTTRGKPAWQHVVAAFARSRV